MWRVRLSHWLHENFAHDPTHVRKVTPIGVAMFDQERNVSDFSNNGKETKLGLLLGIDFRIENFGYGLSQEVKDAIKAGKITNEDVFRMVNTAPNICEEIYIIVQAIKPARNSINILQKTLAKNTKIIDECSFTVE